MAMGPWAHGPHGPHSPWARGPNKDTINKKILYKKKDCTKTDTMQYKMLHNIRDCTQKYFTRYATQYKMLHYNIIYTSIYYTGLNHCTCLNTIHA